MSKLFFSFLLICSISLIVAQKCHGIMEVPLQDNVIGNALAPFDYYGNLCLDLVSILAQYYKDNGIKVIYVAGYYGAGPSIPLEERKLLVKAWEEQCNCLGLDLIVEVGALPFVDTLEFARYCSTLNITAITAFPEIVYQASTESEAVEDLQRICDASGNKLPLLYHDIDIIINPPISTVEVFKGATNGCVSCFVGCATTVNTFLDCKASVDTIAGYQFWGYGVDSVAAVFKVGMNASEIVDLFPDLVRSIRDAVDCCQLEQSEDLQQQLNRRMYAITNDYGGVSDQTTRTYFEQEKAAFQLLSGIDTGYRYPLERPNSTVFDKIGSKLQSLGVRLYTSDRINCKNI